MDKCRLLSPPAAIFASILISCDLQDAPAIFAIDAPISGSFCLRFFTLLSLRLLHFRVDGHCYCFHLLVIGRFIAIFRLPRLFYAMMLLTSIASFY